MIIISDTTPIISLIKINRLDLLEKLFCEVLVPDAVFRELTSNEEEVKTCFEYLKNSNIRLSDSLIQDALSIMKNK